MKMTSSLDQKILYIGILVHLTSLAYGYDCSSSFEFECKSSEIIVTLNDTTTDTFFVKEGSVLKKINQTSYTVNVSALDYVKVLEGYLVKLENNGVSCLILCKKESANVLSNIATSYILPQQQNEVGDVDMRIRETSSESSSEISEAYIGDTMFMFLKYVGKSSYSISPLNCSAYAGNYIPEAGYNISMWNSANCTKTRYFSKFLRIDKKTVYAQMYAFKFKESDDVTFACNVQICMSCNTEICHNSTRFFKRKRKGHQQKHVHTGTTLRIINNPELGNKLQVSDGAPLTVNTFFHLVISLLYILFK